MSEIKVNKISPKQTCTQVTLGDSGDDFVVASGVNFKTAAVKDAAGNVIVSRCGSNITIGSSGAAVALACGATQTGFGRTGTVDWDTTAKTANFTAVSGNGYFVNTTSGAITVTLPAGSAGDIISLADYAATWQTNNVTVSPDGTDKIGGTNASATLNTEGQSVTFVYTDSTQGWINTMDSTSNVRAVAFLTATGGTEVTCGDYKTHIFTSPGTFCVSSTSSIPANNEVEYLVVAGGGGAGVNQGGGGGAGGFRSFTALTPATPINGPAGLPVSVTAYPITVGGGGAGGGPSVQGSPGSNAIFSTITSTGGGGAGTHPSNRPGLPGGSGGGAGGRDTGGGSAGSGNTPPVAPPQGNNGFPTTPGGPSYGGGGGGAIAAASSAAGGDGTFIPTSFIGPTSPSYGETGPAGRYFSGGGGGRSANPSPAAGGLGGGGNGVPGGGPGTVNTGGGGGADGGSGGSGIVMIRYKYQ